MRQHITLTRECEAAEIPYGGRVTLPLGSEVVLTQALGGSFTVLAPDGSMVRIAGKDADALGEELVAEAAKHAASFSGDRSLEQMAWDQLRTCYDPEIPVNIVDLGLVYTCAITSLPSGGFKATVQFTLTAPGCGMGDYMREDIRSKLLSIPTVEEADVEVVLEPVWDYSRMSDAARLQLGLI